MKIHTAYVRLDKEENGVYRIVWWDRENKYHNMVDIEFPTRTDAQEYLDTCLPIKSGPRVIHP